MAYETRFKSDEIDRLFDAILQLKDRDECYRLFEDLCTIKEIRAMGQRFHVAYLLSEEKTYSEIEKIT
ncbi:MAG: TrpR-like protein YerC/YecD, partial [Firmicutes bacterium]|nr:TrpR-like protein YerC/YecD [Bacillota bacterium]